MQNGLVVRLIAGRMSARRKQVNKFELYNPIRMVFGVGEFERLPEFARKYGVKPLVVFGQKSAKERKNGNLFQDIQRKL